MESNEKTWQPAKLGFTESVAWSLKRSDRLAQEPDWSARGLV